MEQRSRSRELPEGMFVADDEELPRGGIDRHRIDDELYQHVPENRSEWAEYVMAEDGMPKPKVPTQMPYAPPLHPDTLCCIVDTRSFVIRGKWGDVLAEFEPAEVSRAIDGTYRVDAKLGEARLQPVVDRLNVKEQQGSWEHKTEYRWWEVLKDQAQREYRYDEEWTEVEPVRPQCKHFVRQLSDFQDLPDHAFLARLCTARRDDGGEFLGLRDTQMFTCDLRDPFDLKGTDRADKFDENKLILGQERLDEGDLWDVDAALDGAVGEARGDPADTGGGVFRKG